MILVLIGHYRFEVATFRKDDELLGQPPPGLQSPTARTKKRTCCRRDFTINGMLYDPIEEEAIDYVGGMDDIRDGIIRTIGVPLDEVQRRQAQAHAGGEIRIAVRVRDRGRHIRGALKKLASGINLVSAERIRDELVKIITQKNPGAGSSC